MRASKTKTGEINREEDEQDTSADVFELLKTDHRHVQELFGKFEDADKRDQAAIADETLTALEVHTALEEELVYPAINDVIDEEDLIHEAKEEHHVATLLIKELRKMDVGDDGFATKFKVLGELVGHHIEEEEGELFPQAEEGGLDATELGQEVQSRKEKLMQKHEGKKSGARRKKAA
ncbi:MAG TPA: hemerythrin domain-containing protein [Nitrospira sp.]